MSIRGLTSAYRLVNDPNSVVIHADLVDFVKTLETAGSQQAADMADDVIHAMGANVETLSKQYAPVDTGELVASIGLEAGPQYAKVTAPAPHAVYVEFGTWSYNELAPQTGTYEIKPVRAKSLKFEVEGRTVFAKSVRHPGIKAKPFMRPALDDTIDEFTEGMGNVGVSILMR